MLTPFVRSQIQSVLLELRLREAACGGLQLQKLYAIVDRSSLDAAGIAVSDFACALRDAGVTLLQYRDKVNGPQQILRAAAEISEVFADVEATLVMNDRADLAALAGWGVHVGQGDMCVADARRVVATGAIVGISTHDPEQVQVADADAADYVAIGPVFRTSTKLDAEPTVGLEGVRRARALTARPLVAIGGITLENARSVIDAGADAVAVVGALNVGGAIGVERRVEEFMRVLLS